MEGRKKRRKYFRCPIKPAREAYAKEGDFSGTTVDSGNNSGQKEEKRTTTGKEGQEKKVNVFWNLKEKLIGRER